MKSVSTVCFCILLSCGTLLADTHYVDISSASPSAPYTSWATAANDIQTAVNPASDGGTVLIADGTYDITTTIYIDKSLTIQSGNGPESVTVDAGGQYYVTYDDDKSQPLDSEELLLKASALIKHNPKAPVLVKGDKDVIYARVVGLMVLLQQAGASGVGLLTDPS